MKTKMSVLFAALLSASSVLCDETDGPAPLKHIWRSESFHVDGVEVPNPELEYEFLDEGRAKCIMPDGTTYVGAYSTDGRSIDLELLHDSIKYTWVGIYEIRGDLLFLYFGPVNSNKRPREFEEMPGVHMLKLKKAG